MKSIKQSRSTAQPINSKKAPSDSFFSTLYAPARRALENANITTLKELSKYSKSDILKLHGIGKTAMPILQRELEKAGLQFRD